MNCVIVIDSSMPNNGPSHSITFVACTSIEFEIFKPSALAVFMLSTNSNRVGCSMGRLPGFAPLNILSA